MVTPTVHDIRPPQREHLPAAGTEGGVNVQSVVMHQGPVAPAIRRSCCAVVMAMPLRFLGIGGSLLVTGLVVATPQMRAESTRYDARDVANGLLRQGPGAFFAVMTAAFQQSFPLAIEV